MKEQNNELLHSHTQTGLFVGQRDMDCFARPIRTLSEHFKKKLKKKKKIFAVTLNQTFCNFSIWHWPGTCMFYALKWTFVFLFSLGHWMKALNLNVLKTGHNLLHLSQERP